MKNVCLRFIYKHLYLIWGTFVACFTGFITGAFTASIIGITIGLGIATIIKGVH